MMPHVPAAFGFYAILTNPVVGYERLAAICAEMRIAFIQLRMKDCDERSVAQTAALVKKVVDGSASRFIINDYPHIARDIGADGVHLGQDDLPYAQARAIVGPDAIIGLSTHSVSQATTACAYTPDYIGVGPVYPTPTKKIADPAIGIEGARQMLAVATVPAVALGAITLESLPALVQCGVRNFAMVRPINQANDPRNVISEILRIYEECLHV